MGPRIATAGHGNCRCDDCATKEHETATPQVLPRTPHVGSGDAFPAGDTESARLLLSAVRLGLRVVLTALTACAWRRGVEREWQLREAWFASGHVLNMSVEWDSHESEESR